MPRLAGQDGHLLDQLVLKEHFYDLCDRYGVAYPKTFVYDFSDPKTPEFDFGFPVIAKPSNSAAYYNSDVTQKATRAQYAEIFANALPGDGLYPINTVADNAVPDVKMSESYATSVYKLYRAGILTGGDVKGTFSPLTYITRAESAAIVSRMAETNNRVSFTLN